MKKEFRILTKLPRGAAPEPLFCSTADEEAITGTEFMVMTFIEVSSITVVYGSVHSAPMYVLSCQ